MAAETRSTSSTSTSTAAAARAFLRTPLTIRADEKLGQMFEQRIRRQLAVRIGHAADIAQRTTVRFEDINGPKGGVDIVCRIKVVLRGRPSILVEKRGTTYATAFADAVGSIGTAVDRATHKGRPHGTRAGRVAQLTRP